MAFKVIKENILKENSETAGKIREKMNAGGTFMINIISSPGAGKTSLLESIGPKLREMGIAFVILTGDCFTSRDAERMDALSLPVAQINTGNACHIDAQLVGKALEGEDIQALDLVIVENVGNLVCPAEFDIGEDEKIALLSTPEGHDKPEKYPLLISESSVAVINKIDLLDRLDFDIEYCERSVKKVNPGIKIMRVSCRTGEGVNDLVEWIMHKIKIKKEKNV
ncbi:MAG: hydrogenase nickel incorporation protein HypB [Candidatus Omnitrophota bacterium]|nr:hydrogenase nickel incorporation protein HypB [Candidatus Omnitrophota bacterium]